MDIIKSKIFLKTVGFAVIFTIFLFNAGFSIAASKSLYFPPKEGEWEKVSLDETGWDAKRIKSALDYAESQNSSGVVVLYSGRLLAEQYWQPKVSEAERSLYKVMLVGKTPDGRAVEDVASVQKSVISFLATVAQDRGSLDIDGPVTGYLGPGWSQATPEQEATITVRHLMSMTSGLNDWLDYANPAGSVWKYRNGPYSLMVPVLTKATRMDIHQLTREWLTMPMGMTESRWESRPWVRGFAANTIGFVSSARDLARFGLLILAEGKWNGHAVIENPEYLRDALRPSQTLKPSYGLLWWRIGPDNAVAALGRLSRMVYIAPEKKLIIVRIGDQPKDHKRVFRHDANPGRTGRPGTPFR